MSKQETYTTEQRLAGAFVEINASARYVLEVLDMLRDQNEHGDGRMDAMVSHVELMVQRMGYVNQAAAHLACPGVLDAPDLAEWMGGVTVCLTPRTSGALPTAGARVFATVEA